jgi:H+/gluconate symporter-like permease
VIGSIKNDVSTWVSYGILIGMILGLIIAIIYGSLIQEKENIEENKTSK